MSKRPEVNNGKAQDMTLALSGPDNVQKDKRYHNQTEETLTFMTRNARKMKGR